MKTKVLQAIFKHRFLLSAVFGVAGILFLYQATAKPVYINIDGSWEIINTHANRVGSILQQVGIELHDEDEVYPDLSSLLDETRKIQVHLSHPVSLVLNGDKRTIRTTKRSAVDILASEGIKFLPGDRLWIDGIPEIHPEKVLSFSPTSIHYKSGVEIAINIDGQRSTLHSTSSSVGEALMDAGIQVFEGDLVQPSLETSLKGVEEISLQSAAPITILHGDTSLETHVVAESVQEALQKAGLPLTGLDYAIPDGKEPIPEDGLIQVVRVVEEILIEQTPIPFEAVYVANPELEIDNQLVIDNGAYGVLANQIRVRYENGEEVSRTVEGEWVARDPQPRKVGYGTKIVIRTLSTPDGSIQYWRALQMWATSYSPSRAGVPDDYEWFGITACGKKLVKGLVAIDNRYIPFYTQMYVPGYGFAEACDIGGGVKGRWIDLGYEDHNYKSWHQYVTVYFLTPVPPTNSITWIFP